MTNPLLAPVALPLFDQIQPEHVSPAIDALLARAETALAEVTQDSFAANWTDISRVLDVATENLSRAWGAVSHLNSVADTPELRAAYNATRQAAREEMEVKERLRQLRHKRMEEDPDDDPLLNATDAAEVLDADEDDLEEALLEVPHGYVICAALPSQEALKFVGKPASAASKELEDRRIIRRWEGFGWCVGTITSVNEDARR